MKFWKSEYTFDHPWETVVQAALRKYPNPMNTAVIGIDVVDRKVVNGVLHTHRLVGSTWHFPKWAQSIIGTANVCYASEKSEVDPTKKEMLLKTANITFGHHINVDETLRYTPHPDDPQKTLLTQEATVKVHVPLSYYMEDMITSKISANATKGRLGLEWVIGKINSEVKEIADAVSKSTDDILNKGHKQFDDMTESARKSMDEISTTAKQKMGF